MLDIKQRIDELIQTPSDINEHLGTLVEYAKECSTVTEMGVRWGTSTWAFLYAAPAKLTSYDIQKPETWNISTESFTQAAKEQNVEYRFILGNVLDVEIEETDLLFIDTWHAYRQLKAELALHSAKVRKYIILHDTTSYGDIDETSYEMWGTEWIGEGIGIWRAVEEFLETNKSWRLRHRFPNNNGLTILERI